MPAVPYFSLSSTHNGKILCTRTGDKAGTLLYVQFPASQVVVHLHGCYQKVLVDVLMDDVWSVELWVDEDDMAL